MGCLFLLSIVLMLLLYMAVHGMSFPIKHSFNAFVIHGGSWDGIVLCLSWDVLLSIVLMLLLYMEVHGMSFPIKHSFNAFVIHGGSWDVFYIQITTYKSEATERKGYGSLQQQELVNPPFKCCEIVNLWKAFISEGVPKGCFVRKKA